MKKLFLFIMACLQLISEELQMKYLISQDKIHSQQLFANAPSFAITNFGRAFEVKIPASKIYTLFKNQGFILEKPKFDEVEFVYKLPWDVSNIESILTQKFKDFYASYHPQVKRIRLKPLGELVGNKIQILSATFDPKSFKKNQLILMLEVQIDKIKKLHPFLCEIDAELEVYMSTSDIRAGEDLDEHNTRKIMIPFSAFASSPAVEVTHFASRSFIKKDQVILESKLKPKIIVHKGDLVDVLYYDEMILIEARLEAMQNAGMSEEILLKNLQSKKSIKAKIIGANKALVQ